MTTTMIFDKAFFYLRYKLAKVALNKLRQLYWKMLGMRIGLNVHINKLFVTWPHQVAIGRDSLIEENVFFKYDGIWAPGPSIKIGSSCFIGASCEFNIRKEVSIGDNALIASGCKFIDHDHGFSSRDLPINKQTDGIELPIIIEDDVWLGVNVIVTKGVSIGRGAIVGAGSFVNKSIPSYEIWAGIPAKKIAVRK